MYDDGLASGTGVEMLTIDYGSGQDGRSVEVDITCDPSTDGGNFNFVGEDQGTLTYVRWPLFAA